MVVKDFSGFLRGELAGEAACFTSTELPVGTSHLVAPPVTIGHSKGDAMLGEYGLKRVLADASLIG